MEFFFVVGFLLMSYSPYGLKYTPGYLITALYTPGSELLVDGGEQLQDITEDLQDTA